MAWHRISRVAQRAWIGLYRDQRSVVVLLAVPIVTLLLIGFVLQHRSSALSVDVVTANDKLATTSTASYLEQALNNDHVSTDRVPSVEAANHDIRGGGAQAYVVIDDQTASAVFAGDASKIAVGVAGDDGARSSRALAAIGRALTASSLNVVRDATSGAPRSGAEASFETTFVYGGPEYGSLDYVAPALLATLMFLSVLTTTLVAMTYERMLHTLERFMATALRRSELLLGYIIGYGAVSVALAAINLFIVFTVLHVHHAGNLESIFAGMLVTSFLALSLGVMLSSLARTEAQAGQMLPLVLVPQIIVCGVLFPLASLPGVLRVGAHFLPVTYSVGALRGIMIKDQSLLDPSVAGNIAVMLVFAAIFIAVGVRRLHAEYD